jgi:hypothetical protein
MKAMIVCGVFAVLIMAGFICGRPDSAGAVEVEIHGYGFQGYLLSQKNEYRGASGGTYNFNVLALLFSSRVTDDTTVWALIDGDSEKISVDWAYIEHRVTDSIDVRFGQVKFPMAIYNEYRDNKLLQISMLEPIMYRAEADVIFEVYQGAGAQYRNGPFAVDLFGGAPRISAEETKLTGETAKNLVGGRVVYTTPIKGLKLIGSYAGFKQELKDSLGVIPEKTTYQHEGVGSLDYVNYGLDLKAEYAEKVGLKDVPGGAKIRIQSYYVQAGYTFFDKLTPFVRYDYITTDFDQKSDASFYQKEFVAGAGYKFSPYFGIKVEEHFISGYALPVQLGKASGGMDAGTGQRDWSLFVAGINFMF